MTTAILDRLLYHVHMVQISGRSSRLKELGELLRPPATDGRCPEDATLTACGETQAAQFSRWGLERLCIPAEPPPHRENWRYAALGVAFRSKYTRASSPGGGSSLTRLVSRAPRRSRRSPGFHHRLSKGRIRRSPCATQAGYEAVGDADTPVSDARR